MMLQRVCVGMTVLGAGLSWAAPVPVPAGASRAAISHGGDRTTIDVMWVVTPASIAAAGGIDQIQALVDQDVASANDAFASTELPFRVRFVGLFETDYDESGDHLGLVRGQGDGVMDEVHALRDSVAADIVVILPSTGTCGLAYVAPNNEAFGFQQVALGCMGGGAFRHELGHNLGSKHWWHNGGGYFPYSAGHVLSLRHSPGTAMGGNNLGMYSNPRQLVSGVPAGVPLGQAESADNYLAFMQTAPMVASFRDSGDCDANGVSDAFEIAQQLAEDCDGNGVPDRCQADLNDNGVIDAFEGGVVTVSVPDDFESVQLALAMVESGVHEIEVGPGVWTGPVDMLGKAVRLRSRDGAQATTITGSGIGRAVLVRCGEGRGTVIEGFTITGGVSDGDGAGMLIDRASPTVRGCVFEMNSSGAAGGGLRVTEGSPRIESSAFRSNNATFGGAVSVFGGTPEFVSCEFDGNESAADGRGGAVSNWTSNASYEDCAFRGNSATGSGGAMYIVTGRLDTVRISGSMFCENEPDDLSTASWFDGGGNEFLAECEDCLADVNMDGEVTPTDFGAWLAAFNAGDPAADQNEDGEITPTDFGAWLANFNAGCD